MNRGFRGSSPLTLDAKGRMAMPAKFRERVMAACGGSLVIVLTHDACLHIYPLPDWEELEAQIEQLPGLDPAAANFKRRVLGSAEDCHMDGQGRVLIPAKLRESVGLEREVVLVGVGKKFELWSQAAWDEINSRSLGEDLNDLDLSDDLRALPL